MIRILLLDCSEQLLKKVKSEGFDVEAGTIGFVNGIRNLPSQVYEKDVFIYSPLWLVAGWDKSARITDVSPEYTIEPLSARIEHGGATCLIFVNRLTDDIHGQNAAYKWIPFMPQILFTKDKAV